MTAGHLTMSHKNRIFFPRKEKNVSFMPFLGCAGAFCRQSMDTEDRDSKHPLLPGESYQSPLGEAIWCGVTEESLSHNHGRSWQQISDENNCVVKDP